ncbi:hypothetical protein Hamer_G006630 [Homarus americanus]|uniref:Uncharacterized protein n=1 Tax=Homarus americanus TaxID=6706 RepID=A0A8J5JLP4_HOMAM|nr:hypothetical protein Hamer_G006630 [Homarus americanus]
MCDVLDSAMTGDVLDSAMTGDVLDSAMTGDVLDSAMTGDVLDSAMVYKALKHNSSRYSECWVIMGGGAKVFQLVGASLAPRLGSRIVSAGVNM